MSKDFQFKPIGFVQSPFKGKFGIPRQPGLITSAKGVLKFLPDPDLRTALRGLDGFSHLWVLFVFHDHGGKKWKPSIRPPRLGGAQKIGVLASRSPHRPNPLGLSVVKIEETNIDAQGGAEITVSGIDLLDETPILDIKPYLVYADSVPNATGGWAQEEIRRYPVTVSDAAMAAVRSIDPEGTRGFLKLLIEILELDPRPAFQQTRDPVDSTQDKKSKYGFDLQGFDIRYEIQNGGFYVFEIKAIRSKVL